MAAAITIKSTGVDADAYEDAIWMKNSRARDKFMWPEG